MIKLSQEIEEMLNNMDFSRGRKQAVWNKILLRLKSVDEALPLDMLDNVAGGLSEPIDEDENRKNPQNK